MAEIEIRYFAGSAFEITTEKGLRIIVDPCITGYQGRGVSPVKLSEVDQADLILVSHGAPDHLGDTLELAKKISCDIICGPDVYRYLTVKGIKPDRVHRFVWGMTHSLKGITVRSVESHHISIVTAEDFFLTGAPMGFMINTESGICLYHPGDTSIFSDLKLLGELHKPQVGFIPIGGFNGGKAELSLYEAALMTKWLGVKVAIPMHYAAGSPEAGEFEELVRKEAPAARVMIMKPGEKWKYRI